MTKETPIWLQNGTYSARLDRQLIANIFTEGILGSTSFAVTQRGAGANFSVDVAAGVGVVQGDDQANQGKYLCVSTATENVVVTAAPGSNSRYDIVILDVNDATAGGDVGDNFTLRVVAGTVAASPVVPTVPASALLLATIGPITSATASITTSIISDSRLHSDLTHQVVNGASILTSAVSTTKLADASVTTAKIVDLNVTTAKIAANAVTAAKIANSTITGTQIANGSVAAANLVPNSVTTTEINDTVLSSAWTVVTFNTGWGASGTARSLAYKKIGNVVYLVGTAVRSSGSDALVATLPAGFRPNNNVRDWAESGSALPVQVASTGQITVTGAVNGSNVAINMVIPADA